MIDSLDRVKLVKALYGETKLSHYAIYFKKEVPGFGIDTPLMMHFGIGFVYMQLRLRNMEKIVILKSYFRFIHECYGVIEMRALSYEGDSMIPMKLRINLGMKVISLYNNEGDKLGFNLYDDISHLKEEGKGIQIKFTNTMLVNAISRDVKLPGMLFYMVRDGSMKSGFISHVESYVNGNDVLISFMTPTCADYFRASKNNVTVGSVGINIDGAVDIVRAKGTFTAPASVFINPLTSTITLIKGGVVIAKVVYDRINFGLGFNP